ncbi:putative NADP(+)-dependent dehydrogenase [Hypoxylon rubiginosum]|uniref:NADP(+)-dependent dehydrogenase n=1 Tax=Hypoxylon rubiginosum TaxID=110542 RepID=A0ACC0DHE2_9PEZI|nr:putative NADP(+)-dependent dehydrogenase [Hypoxylon rubiginosum]
MTPPLPSATSTWHNDTYAAISPQRPELSAAGKTIIIIGAGSGIGRETARAFATAGASHVALLGRTVASLNETKSQVALTSDKTSTSIHVADITQEKTLQEAAASIGVWDVLVLAAGYTSKPGSLTQTDTAEWWKNMEVNVKGPFLALKTFVPTANPSHATVLGLTSGMIAAPAKNLPGISAYITSKFAQTKMMEFLPVDQPHIFTASVHPGMVETAIFAKAGGDASRLPMDKVQLPAHFLVWLSSPEAAYLNGRTVWANWDVEELKTQADTIQSGQLMTGGTYGWPFPHM